MMQSKDLFATIIDEGFVIVEYTATVDHTLNFRFNVNSRCDSFFESSNRDLEKRREKERERLVTTGKFHFQITSCST